MKYVNEFRDPQHVHALASALHQITTRPWTLMEVCGGQTHAIVKFGLAQLLPPQIRLIHGPGCPVCVTPIALIDHAVEIASHPNVILCSFGDMLRVPGSAASLLAMRAQGADVRIIHSPLEALTLAREHPSREVVFFSVGFETTAPATAMTLSHALAQNLKNFSVLIAHVLVPPALRFLLGSPDNEVQGILAAGHVCTVTGYQEYHALAAQYKTPIVVTGFEPVDLLQGILFCVQQLEQKTHHVLNQYTRSVREEGNREALKQIERFFEPADREWRGIGSIPHSGLALKSPFAFLDATLRFPVRNPLPSRDTGCISGLVLQGKREPRSCPLFGTACTPETPQGAPMVSTEGACSAYYQYAHQGDPR